MSGFEIYTFSWLVSYWVAAIFAATTTMRKKKTSWFANRDALDPIQLSWLELQASLSDGVVLQDQMSRLAQTKWMM